MNYTTMMIDIIESKKINKKNREELQVFIKKTLSVLNHIFEPSLEFEVIFSAGDEFQGLFKNPQAAILYYRLLSLILAPLPIRCGIGYGKWDIRIKDGTSSEQDGPTYHYARLAIKLTQEKKDYTNYKVMKLLSKAQIAKSMRENKMKNPRLRQIVTMLYVFDKVITSKAIKETRYTEFAELINVRMKRHKDYYEKNPTIISAF